EMAYDAPQPIEKKPGAGAIGDPLAGFAGQKAVVHFKSPMQLSAARAYFGDVLTRLEPNAAPSEIYRLLPMTDKGDVLSDQDGEREAFTSFVVAAKTDLPKLLQAVQEHTQQTPTFDPYNAFGPQIAKETQSRALLAVFLSWLVIIIYVWFRFHGWGFGLGGVI